MSTQTPQTHTAGVNTPQTTEELLRKYLETDPIMLARESMEKWQKMLCTPCEKMGLICALTVSGRSTDQGAYTTIKHILRLKGETVKKIPWRSRSGRHWYETLCISSDFTGFVFIVDITNSGRDNSYIIRFENGKAVEEFAWGF